MECKVLKCVHGDVLGSLRLQQMWDHVGSQAPELHLHGSHRQPGHTLEHHAARADDNQGDPEAKGSPCPALPTPGFRGVQLPRATSRRGEGRGGGWG